MTTQNINITGGCLCGAVRYTVTAAPIAARICWCRLCQYLGAGSSTVNVFFPSDAVTITGETRDFVSIADSGNRIHRRFCGTCGTSMFSAAEVRPHVLLARAGTLDDPEIAKPIMTIWTKQAPSWACISADLPRAEGQPPPAG